MGLPAKKIQTLEAFFELEQHADMRHEYYKGEIFDMAGASIQHNEIVRNCRETLRGFFLPKGCKVLAETVLLEALENEYYPYPDIMVTSDTQDVKAKQIIKKPSILIEVLSPSTQGHDMMFKWAYYQKITSLKYYLLVHQNKAKVEMFERIAFTNSWKYQVVEGLHQLISFELFDFEIPLSLFYENIEFENTHESP
jgi:Uma2 family endonuclease